MSEPVGVAPKDLVAGQLVELDGHTFATGEAIKCGQIVAVNEAGYVCVYQPPQCEGPQHGHTFRFTVESRGSSRVWPEGEEPGPYTDNEDFSGCPWTLEVRAWSLRAALVKAAALPLNAWKMPGLSEDKAGDKD